MRGKRCGTGLDPSSARITRIDRLKFWNYKNRRYQSRDKNSRTLGFLCMGKAVEQNSGSAQITLTTVAIKKDTEKLVY